MNSNGHGKHLTGGVMLGSDSIPSLGHGMYQSPQLSSWDSLQIWKITDTAQVGTFRDTIVSPHLFTISFPFQLMHDDSVSMSSGFTISYGATGADSVKVLIKSNSLLAHAIDTTISVSSAEGTYISPLGPSTGSFTVSSSALAAFPAHGVMDIFIIAINSKVSSHSGRQYIYKSVVESQVSTFIKP